MSESSGTEKLDKTPEQQKRFEHDRFVFAVYPTGSTFSSIAFTARERLPELLPEIQKVATRRAINLGVRELTKYLQTKDIGLVQFLGHDTIYFSKTIESFDPEAAALFRELYESQRTFGTENEVNYEPILIKLKELKERYDAGPSYEEEYFALGEKLGFSKEDIKTEVANYRESHLKRHGREPEALD